MSSRSTSSAEHSSVRLETQATVQFSRFGLHDELPSHSSIHAFAFDDIGAIASSYVNGVGDSPPNRLNPLRSGKRKSSSSVVSDAKRSRAEDGMPTFLEGPQWACPLVKHNPERYVQVYNSCTDRKGLGPDLRRVRSVYVPKQLNYC